MKLCRYRIKDFAVKTRGCPRSVSTLSEAHQGCPLLHCNLGGFFLGDKNEFNSR